LSAFSAADAFVAICGDHVPAMALCGREQFAFLVGNGLLAGRDPEDTILPAFVPPFR
jgi:hypothetical protein